jgi:hypothetical protein
MGHQKEEPSGMSASEAYAQLTRQLDEVRHRWRARNVLLGLLTAVACVMAAVLVLVVCDNVLKPGVVGRVVLALAFWGTVAGAFVRFVFRPWRERPRDDYFAVLAEDKFSALQNGLINALQLGRGDHYGSSGVAEAVVNDAAHATADLDLSDCIDVRTLKRAALVAAIAALVVALYAGVLGARFANGLARVLLPVADIPAYTATQVLSDSIKPGGIRVPEGALLTFEARVDGVVPGFAQLHRRRQEERGWVAARMETDATASDTFRYTLQQATKSFDYYVTAGDGRSRTFGVEVVKRPRVENIALTYQPPAYTGLPRQETSESEGDIIGLAGGTVMLRVTPTKPLREATFIATGDTATKIALAQDEASTTWDAGFTLWSDAAQSGGEGAARVTAPARYRLSLTDTEGYENADPVWRTITLTRDQPPSVTIVRPGRDLHAEPGDTVSLGIDARDDLGVGEVKVVCRVNDDAAPRELARFTHSEAVETNTQDIFEWTLSDSGLKSGDLVQYWAVATDRNAITGPGVTESRRFTIFIVTPAVVLAKFEIQMNDFAQALEQLVRLQRENRAQTASGIAFETLVTRQSLIRRTTNTLARAMETAPTSMATMVAALDELHAGLMAQAIGLLESGRDTRDAAKASAARDGSLPVQDAIIEEMMGLLSRLQRNDQARNRLRKMAKTDEAAHKELSETLAKLMKNLDQMILETGDLGEKYEKLPKRVTDELSEESLERVEAFDELTRKWAEWAKGSVDELTKLPSGFVDDFGLRPELERIFEEIEEVAQKPKTTKIEVALEDSGAALATEMLEDLEMWMLDAPDTLQWVMEEPLNTAPMDIPEMPLPDVLQDMVGDLLEEAADIDMEAEDVTSAWGDSLNQAGWAVMDGPISNFSAKGVTGNVLPNDIELGGRAGDGRRGKSSGQMVSETTRNLEGRKTPARVGAERYEPGVVKEEQSQDPGGATGGGKKSGAGEKGLQGGSPPDFVKDMERMRQLQVGLRERATQVANRLEVAGVSSQRLNNSIEMMKGVEDDLRDLRYQDASRRRRVALSELRAVPNELDQSLAVQLSRARELPRQLREELIQAADESYPEGYESMLKSYYRALSEAEGR